MLQLRLAKWDELPVLAKIGAAAFAEDPIYLHFNPWRSVYPEDWQRGFLHTLQWRYAEPGSAVMVAESRDENQNLTVVGYITATRRGANAQPLSSWMQQPNEWGHQVATSAQQAEAHVARTTLSRCVDPDAVHRFYVQYEQILGGSLANTLEAQTLGVLPGSQRGGVGRALLMWLFDMAAAEGVPIIADASAKGIQLYLRIGYRIQDTIVLDARESRLQGTETAVQLPRVEVPVIKWDPSKRRALL